MKKSTWSCSEHIKLNSYSRAIKSKAVVTSHYKLKMYKIEFSKMVKTNVTHKLQIKIQHDKFNCLVSDLQSLPMIITFKKKILQSFRKFLFFSTYNYNH